MKYIGVKPDQIMLAGISEQSLVNGPGLRKVYFSQGCIHHCQNCFNPET
jgi:anaerobic ribonucleoside-triphosphate reductase activating protein